MPPAPAPAPAAKDATKVCICIFWTAMSAPVIFPVSMTSSRWLMWKAARVPPAPSAPTPTWAAGVCPVSPPVGGCPGRPAGSKSIWGGGCASKICHKEDARPALGDAPVLRVQSSPSQGGSVSHNGPSRVPCPARRSRHCTGRRRDPHGFFQDDSEIFPFRRAEGSRHVLPHHESWANKLSWPFSMLIHLPHFTNETYLF